MHTCTPHDSPKCQSTEIATTMGQKVAKVRSLEDSNAELKERLLFLEIVTKRHLDAKLGTLFSEGDGDGFILELHKRV